jgi:prepilin-type N-terminal cleavage/methylation domain-containing protein
MNSAPPGDDAGFTLTELVAALFVAALLIAGLAEITHRYAQGAVRAKAAISEAQTSRTAQALMSRFERIDAGSLEMSSSRLRARRGDAVVEARIYQGPDGRQRLDFSFPEVRRQIAVGPRAHFEQTASGAILLLTAPDAPPLAVVVPMRDTPFNCAFDPISRECR